MAEEPKAVSEEDLRQLKDRMKLIAEADPAQYHNDYSLKRYLRAFKTVDSAFQVCTHGTVIKLLVYIEFPKEENLFQ